MVAQLDFVKPTDDILHFIASHMRIEDVAEVVAAGSATPYDSLVQSVGHSKACCVALYKGIPLSIFGLGKMTHLSDGLIWMLGTNYVRDYPKEIMHYTRRVLKEMHNECPVLYNYVHARNTVSIKWLASLGFTIEDPEPRGPYGELFHKFYKRVDNV